MRIIDGSNVRICLLVTAVGKGMRESKSERTDIKNERKNGRKEGREDER